jgi:hypothetical protein
VSEGIAQEQVARVEASVGSDPGAPEFPALAEALRSAGTWAPTAAAPVETAAGTAGFDIDVTEGEIAQAFDSAEPDLDQVVDADRVAQEAMRVAALDQPEAVSVSSDPMFSTETMAELLERQGDAEGAAQIRVTLEADAGAAGAGPFDLEGDPEGGKHRPPPAPRERVIGILENWLENLRGGRR